MSHPHPDYEVVIGLEVHVQLATRTKLFSSAAVSYGEEPNRHVTPVCLALPGALPVLNGLAVELAVRAGLAVHGEVHPNSVFARKNYFYPDLPKGYQISQFEEPIVTGGWLDIAFEQGGELQEKRVALTRIHMEEDAGKSLHEGADGDTRVDLNRAGVPLVEIVSEPDLRSPEEAAAYLRALQEILRYIGASDADMEKGQFRCDANVSLRPHGAEQLGTRTEIKNVNSFRNVEAAIRAEIDRQADVIDEGGAVVQATMGYDADADRTFLMRTKENADDYRYFPDPDLIPLVLTEQRIEEIRAGLPELPEERRRRIQEQHELSAYDARLLTASRGLADWFEAAAAKAPAKAVANWILRDVLAALKEQGAEIDAVRLAPEALATVVTLVEAGSVTTRSARQLVAEILFEGGDPEALIAERGLAAVSDEGALEALADEVIAGNEKAAQSYRDGDKKSLNFLMGQVMKKSQGKADPGRVREILARKLEG
jgi:aspartyl-tRNA(Asn)/glutamyl-tRNA(Gln) amidotransferase subunit B